MTRAVTLRDAEALVGLPYVAGEFDCMHLARLAQRTLFCREVPEPVTRHPRTRAAQAQAIEAHRAQVAQPQPQPETGDAVLFIDQDDRGRRQMHIGTLIFSPTGEAWVLHIRAGDLSLLQRLEDCKRCGLRVEGFYRWIA